MPELDVAALLEAARPLIDLALAEDIGPGDATSQATLPAESVAVAHIRAKAPGIIAGLPVAEAVFRRVDAAVQFVPRAADGQEVAPGEVVADLAGPARSLLAAERTALNFLQHLSGIATHTRRFVDAVACTRADILDTRKTLPGYRALDKYAVRMGGGVNHRMSLFDMILIKDNHVDAAGGITTAVARARSSHPDLPVEVEVRTLDELSQALALEPAVDRIMLDNMSLETMRQAVAMADAIAACRGGRPRLEASGNVTLERAESIAATGVDLLSVGSITHSAPALDLSMKVVRPGVPSAEQDLYERVAALKAALGSRLAILGHHYQRDEILAHADYTGDSLKLARDSAEAGAEYIVFCGVHFMAETAAILAKPGQHVVIPDPAAGCYLADTATPAGIEAAWWSLDAALGGAEDEVMPITYVNSSAQLKAFCGRHGGIVCTSGSALRALAWALEQRPRVFFFPDQHLGLNSARRHGIALDETLLWTPGRPPGPEAVRHAKVILWPGACNVHQRFRTQDIVAVRRRYPGIRVVVHPECKPEVVDLADDSGSTASILDQIQAASPGSMWAIGTESRMVRRLQKEHPDQLIVSLASTPPFCRTMAQITLPALASVLDGLARGEIINKVTVEPETAHWARRALERMLSV
jgi:quinolinate synthase